MSPMVITAILLIGVGLSNVLTSREMIRVFNSIITIVLGLLLATAAEGVNEEAALFSIILLVTTLLWTAFGSAIIYRRKRISGVNDFQEKNELKN